MSSAKQPSSRTRRPSKVHDPYRRTSLACEVCRKRKTKCTGEQPCCRYCKLHNLESKCHYLEQEQKIAVSKSYFLQLKARLAAYESGAVPSGTPLAEPSPTAIDVPEHGESDAFEDNPLTEGLTHLTITPSGQRHYLGHSSATSWALRLRNFVENDTHLDQDLKIEVQYPTYNPAAWPKRRPSLTDQMRLPPYDFCRHLYHAQYQYIGTIFSFVPPRIFEERLRRAHDDALDLSDRESCLEYCQVLLILAYGQLYSVNQWNSPNGPPGFDFFMQALEFLPDIHEEGSVLFVEVLSLVGYFMQNLHRRDAAFLYIGLALRMAISLGLHQEMVDPDLDEATREHRRRLWWSVYSMDRILCAKSGNPITILDEDIGVLPASRLPDEPEICPAIVLSHYTQLSRITGRIMNDIYRKTGQSVKTGHSLVASVSSIMNDLNSWRRDLPPTLQFDRSRLDNGIPRETVSVFLHFYQCVNMTARPLLFRIVQRRLASGTKETDWKTGLSPMTIQVIKACIGAARDSTAIMQAAARQNQVANFGWMDSEHLFSAAIVLVMINLAFPHNPRDVQAMDTALEVLRGMAEKGNSYIRARHELLTKLRSMGASRPSSSDDVLEDATTSAAAMESSSPPFNASNRATGSAHRPSAQAPTSSPPAAAPPPYSFASPIPMAAPPRKQSQHEISGFPPSFPNFPSFASSSFNASANGTSAGAGTASGAADVGLWEDSYGTFDAGMNGVDWDNFLMSGVEGAGMGGWPVDDGEQQEQRQQRQARDDEGWAGVFERDEDAWLGGG
ncbi:fungal-specific transcription factor domain-containing protein [Phyllosticta capitalensis]|uniref:fungal-specific transcription factor domain-containing protein n=1 Tax=Phyllosticta capitalensis TaxID=121624 RepID=UPI00312E4317